MAEINQKKHRDFDFIEPIEEVFHLLKTQFSDKRLYVKYFLENNVIQINEYLDDKTLMVVTDPEYLPLDNIITIYGLLDKYIEIDLEVVETRGPGYFKCKVQNARKAISGRKDLRFKVSSDQVNATNFRVSKHSIDLSNFKIPTSIKVILEQFQSQKSGLSDIVRVDILDGSDRILDLLKKTGDTIFIEDVSNPEAYKSNREGFADLYQYLDHDLNQYIKKNIERGYKSIIMVPLIYITETNDSIPFAYIQLISKKEIFTFERVIEVKELTFNIIRRIQDANTLLITVHQEISDISRGGARLRIQDDNLKKYLFRTRGFIFDIVFKLQAPVTIYGEIKYLATDKNGVMEIGIDFAGNSSRKDEMKRFYSILRPMEMDYKNKLLKKIKDQKRIQK